jgi:hypothetical protein
LQTNYFSEDLAALGIEAGAPGSVARNSDHHTTEAVIIAHTGDSMFSQKMQLLPEEILREYVYFFRNSLILDCKLI